MCSSDLRDSECKVKEDNRRERPGMRFHGLRIPFQRAAGSCSSYPIGASRPKLPIVKILLAGFHPFAFAHGRLPLGFWKGGKHEHLDKVLRVAQRFTAAIQLRQAECRHLL